VGDANAAAQKFRETSNLPELCGRLCPQERLCEVSAWWRSPSGRTATTSRRCRSAKLEAFVTTTAHDHRHSGAGAAAAERLPRRRHRRRTAGMAVAEELAKQGHACTMYDAWPEPGGVLLYGIRASSSQGGAAGEGALLEELGVRFIGNTWVGKDVTIDDLLGSGFDAVFVGTGAGVGRLAGDPGRGAAATSTRRRSSWCAATAT